MDLDTALTGKPTPDAGAVQMLRSDHAEVRRLAREYRAAAGADEHAAHVVLEALMMQAELHARVEEDVFYPAVRQVAPDFVQRAVNEHHTLAARIDELEGDSAPADAADTLIDELLRHLDDEERELFPEVERRLGTELQTLGEAMEKRRTELTRDVKDLEGPAT